MAEEQEDTKTEETVEKSEESQNQEISEHKSETESPDTDENITEAVDLEKVEEEVEIDTDVLNHEIENLRQQLADNADTVLRNQAEMENLRKRTARDVENAYKYALDKFIKELLPVIDSMELGITASGGAEDIETFREGMDLTLRKFLDTLEKFGVSAVEPQGEKFDPAKHEAVSMQELEDAESGTVITVMQKGYELNGRLVRPAMVIVAK